MLWAHTDQRGGKLATVGKLYLCFGCTLDDMEIGHNMAGSIPYETGARSARHAVDITCPEIGNSLPCRYEDNGLSGIAEQVDSGAFICAKVSARSDHAWLGHRTQLAEE